MDLNCETILDFYTHKDKKILCQIKVASKSDKLINSCRSLTQEQWKDFDSELEKLITAVEDWNNEKCLEFNIQPNIRVRVQKSKLSLKNFWKCLGTIGVSVKGVDGELANVETNLVLECLFELNCTSKKKFETVEIDTANCAEYDDSIYSPKPISDSADKIAIHKSKLSLVKSTCSSNRKHKYTKSDVSELNYETESHLRASRSSKDCCKMSSEDEISYPERNNFSREKSNENIKTLKPRSEKKITDEKLYRADNTRTHKNRFKSDDVLLELNDENAKDQLRSKGRNSRSDVDENPVATATISVENIPPKNPMQDSKIKLHEKLSESNKISQCNTIEVNNEKVSSSKELHSVEDKETKIALTEDKVIKKDNKTFDKEISRVDDSSSPLNIRRRAKKSKHSSKEPETSLRRSKRSPSKPKRFIEEQSELLVKIKSKKHQTSLNHKELFGTDDDDDDDIVDNKKSTKHYNSNKINPSIFDTPMRSQSAACTSSSSSSTKQKRKREKSPGCQQEKRDMSKWLSKKKLITSEKERSKLSKTNTKSSSYKPLPLKTKSENLDKSNNTLKSPISFELPSKDELELMRNKSKLMQEQNAKVRAELEKMRTSPPKEVEILTIRNIPVNEILDTFIKYKSELDEIYQSNIEKDYIKGHDGINHCFVIRLLEQNIQMKMLEKLTEVYNTRKSTTQVTLFANALLPEWVIRVYMEKFDFTRQQAIEQVKAQEEFQLHMEEQNDNTFIFD